MTSQPSPTSSINSRIVLREVVKDLAKRAEHGKQTYGTLLKTHNGRDALIDAYEEALDLLMYLKQMLMEREDHTSNLDTGLLEIDNFLTKKVKGDK